ncbi:hypothetical protein J008_02329 [Cryptococcus neoformans]|nr:hypothetical protein C362_01960 [Cryptococcus neoformans var. grubii Bt1]OWZ62289.1 hypothetical protein AYX15_05568 [Cryptococcus neoformans var. grubii]OWZ78985.1 hypothetical protein C365_02634 [Cryptococcus neoformans var. grubii Bt85]OXG19634.1 hypothetical protein C366_02489 [Cryptococcus neoformans var. grubii Tu401-1]OXM79750.1 hypothetical protein C364_02453 [Cryptococcus neoformans var. grubii Bt63]
MSLPTPNISHFTESDYEHIYEPAEDSFILLDALELDAQDLRRMNPSVCVEIGAGSGVVSAFMSNLLGHENSFVISTDINLQACQATTRTGRANNTILDPIQCNLVDPLLPRLSEKVDILLFNPPYVPTDNQELQMTQESRDIGGAWAGGADGMAITNILLQQLPSLLSRGGRLYLVAIHQNNTEDINARMLSLGLQSQEIIKRRAGRELLSVLRISKPT